HQPPAEHVGYHDQWHTHAQTTRPVQVGRQVTIAQSKPRLVCQAAESRLHDEGIAGDPPASLEVGDPGQPVGNGVEVGSHIQAVPPDVVGGASNAYDLGRRADLDQPA